MPPPPQVDWPSRPLGKVEVALRNPMPPPPQVDWPSRPLGKVEMALRNSYLVSSLVLRITRPVAEGGSDALPQVGGWW